jgi:hypothetical protein
MADAVSDATTLLQRSGPTQDAGSMTLVATLDLQGSFYDARSVSVSSSRSIA